MKLRLLLASVVLAFAACTTTPTDIESQAKQTVATVTQVRQASMALLQAKKITVAQDEAVQVQLDGIVAAATAAKNANDAAALAKAQAELKTIQGAQK